MKLANVACALVLVQALTASPANAGAPCCPHPYDYAMHAGFGVGLGYLGAHKWHPAVGILLSAAAGVGKERFDKKYDPKDAFATLAGGLLGVGLYFAIGRDDKEGVVLIGHNMLGYRIRFH